MVAQAVAAIALVLLGASGVAKLVDPAPTTGAMRAVRLPSSKLVTYLLGLFEVVSAVTGLTFGGPFLYLSATLYVGFTIFTFAAVRKRIPVQSCGCFGRDDTPPSWVHVAYNVGAAVAVTVVAVRGGSPLDDLTGPIQSLLFIVFAGAGAYASYLMLSRLPQLNEVTRR